MFGLIMIVAYTLFILAINFKISYVPRVWNDGTVHYTLWINGPYHNRVIDWKTTRHYNGELYNEVK